MQAEPVSIRQALDSWKRDLVQRNLRETSLARYTDNVEKVASWAGWQTAKDVDLQSASDALSKRMEAGWSSSTHDAVAAALRSFGKHLHRSGYVDADPLMYLENIGEENGTGARAATTEELRALIKAGQERYRRDRRAKLNSAMFYTFLALTGLRDYESSKVCWNCVDLDKRWIHVDKGGSKNRRSWSLPINDELHELLFLQRKLTGGGEMERVFPQRLSRHTFTIDREMAKIPYEDARGEKFTMHGLRKWLATTLDATGATPSVKYKIMRHAGNLPEDHTSRPDDSSLLLAVQRLPRIWREDGASITEAELPLVKSDTRSREERLAGRFKFGAGEDGHRQFNT